MKPLNISFSLATILANFNRKVNGLSVKIIFKTAFLRKFNYFVQNSADEDNFHPPPFVKIYYEFWNLLLDLEIWGFCRGKPMKILWDYTCLAAKA